MATTEEQVDKLETRFTTLEQQFATTMAKVDMLVQEMRDRDNQRAAEIIELRQKQDALQASHAAEMHEMNQRFYDKVDANQKEFTKELHSNFVQTMLGVGAIMAAIGGLIVAILK